MCGEALSYQPSGTSVRSLQENAIIRSNCRDIHLSPTNKATLFPVKGNITHKCTFKFLQEIPWNFLIYSCRFTDYMLPNFALKCNFRWYRVIKISVHLKITIQKVTSNVQSVPRSLQTFIDTPNCVLEERVQYSTVHIPNVFCDGHLQTINCVGTVRIQWVFVL
jgi:hypothetical protein